jgi:hypothetical protein
MPQRHLETFLAQAALKLRILSCLLPTLYLYYIV